VLWDICRVSKYIHKRHNVSVLLYHLVCPAKYRRVVFTEDVDAHLKDVCLEIAKRYEIQFVEIGTDHDHVHFLIQSVPSYSPTQIARIVKSITEREIFQRVPSVKKLLWGRRVLVKRILHKYRWPKGQRRNDSHLCSQSRSREWISKATSWATYAVLTKIPRSLLRSSSLNAILQ
jgi:REP element-mobilizing transposase RayT